MHLPWAFIITQNEKMFSLKRKNVLLFIPRLRYTCVEPKTTERRAEELIDLTALNARITASGIKRTVIAREMNVSPPTLRRKLRGNTPMTDNDMETLGKVLNLNRNEMMRIFFAREMN